MTRLQMTKPSRLALLLALPVAGLFASATRAAETAQASACFEIIRPQPRTQPRAPLLLDRCTGSTWLLVRSGSPLGYRWAPLEAPVMVQAVKSDAGAVAPKPREDAAPPTANCFAFAGRRYCQ